MSQDPAVEEIAEVIEQPLTPEALGAMYRRLCDDPCFASIPGKIELDPWGRMVMRPASNYHGMVKFRLGQRLLALPGQAFSEASILTAAGLLVADDAWASPEFLSAHGTETPFTRAPELCNEIASPSSSRRGLQEKVAACIAAGAPEVWVVYTRSGRIAFHDSNGPLERTAYPVDLDGLFDRPTTAPGSPPP